MTYLFVAITDNPGALELKAKTRNEAEVAFENLIEDWRTHSKIVDTFYLCKVLIRQEIKG